MFFCLIEKPSFKRASVKNSKTQKCKESAVIRRISLFGVPLDGERLRTRP